MIGTPITRSSHSRCSTCLLHDKRLLETNEGRIRGIEERNLVLIIPAKIALDPSNNSVSRFGGVGFSTILLLSLHYEATQFLRHFYCANSKKVSKLVTSFASGFEDRYCSRHLPLCLLRHALRSGVVDVILGDWWGKLCLLLRFQCSSQKSSRSSKSHLSGENVAGCIATVDRNYIW